MQEATILELAFFVIERMDSMASMTKDLVSFKVDLTLWHCQTPAVSCPLL